MARVALWGKGERAVACLRALCDAGHEVVLVVGQPGDERLGVLAGQSGLTHVVPDGPNEPAFVATLREARPDVGALCGYGLLLEPETVAATGELCVNLHGGLLPGWRGSSPLNWALIRGEREVGVSVLAVDTGVDTGEILAEARRAVAEQTTIADLHAWANRTFPRLLLDVLAAHEAGTLRGRPQADAGAAYWPLRRPQDGLVLWDTLTAAQAHDRIRALTDPYPNAYTFHRRRRLRLLASEHERPPFHGHPGRVYRVTERGALVCASDRALWITRTVWADSGADALDDLTRYDDLATVAGTVLGILEA